MHSQIKLLESLDELGSIRKLSKSYNRNYLYIRQQTTRAETTQFFRKHLENQQILRNGL
jgi:molybdenum-dependent DNA-binding transcriptional regulator ModE